MEHRLFRLLCLAAAGLTLLVIVPTNWFIHLSPSLTFIDLAFGVLSVYFFRQSCRQRYFIKSFFLLFLVNLNLCWFGQSGSQGSNLLFFFDAFIYALIFFRGRERWLFLSLAIADAVALIASEPHFTRWLTAYSAPAARVVDLTLSLTLSAFSCALMLWAVLTSYDREQRRLESLNAELQRNMAERLEAEELLRQNQDEIRLLNAELDQRVRERTARLQAAMLELESFSYSVSHDLRAPLRHINSYSAILEEDHGSSLTPEALGYLDRIRLSSRSMGKLIDDLLELSRIGRSQMQKTTVNLSELANEISFRLANSDPERRVEFIVAPDLTVCGDRVLLQQALSNLLENAWKYTCRRESACVEVGRIEEDGEEVFFVRDNGVGFDMAYQDKLFGAFQRLHGAEFEGTGVGLAMVKRIIKRHGGRVWAQGAVGQGTTVYFTLDDETRAGA